MGYGNIGKRPFERASKSSHSNLANDQSIRDYIERCKIPEPSENIQDELADYIITLNENSKNPIESIIAIDGGYTEVTVRKEFPSAKLAFFQFGASCFKTSDLDDLSKLEFIDESDMSKLKDIEKLKLVLPIKGVSLASEHSLKDSVRKTIYEFFKGAGEKENSHIESLKWLIYNEYLPKKDQKNEYTLSQCPNCGTSRVKLHLNDMASDYTFKCEECGEKIYLTDVFRLHEVVDEELGAGGILGYMTSVLEQMHLVHIIRSFWINWPEYFEKILFIRDGPLSFVGNTATIHSKMRELTNYLLENYNLYLVGLEKSGSFVDHALQIQDQLKPGQALLLKNDYIYKYIIPGRADPDNPYAGTSYYSSKIIFKSKSGYLHVLTLPTKSKYVVLDPKKNDFKNIDEILLNLEKLKCEMYDGSIIPIALVNKLVSISDHPSKAILENFAKNHIQR
ncbi:rRNA maturation protein Nop10 [Methanococcus maripaludis]|uniref:rRNA maturation protein Nop10 n=1 Tax=Methanococcus maripaludis TaxID=39152 RepID=A0A7J9NV14_METMI|nr:DNA double-strand break repair nuclease NurA [Methanococcus maripaludis]MBA2851165.1 rRNA maturation protein Nop10 [Methanococcus maripaludis]MBA2858666.1 rRNA maturation protein Nop10 [Methanococcus maripaludis]